ncbi:efflux RND transporter periplasmic adaptor subunit [Gracilimonas sp. Q87]|uniref:efflux RND transporter periplasmic adaptor subunit n=1 Tax=Gracilimonas sp. Q87 TaxID=3384766 RepID=UPI0039840C72
MKFQLSILALFLFATACGNGDQGNGEDENRRSTPVYLSEIEPSTFKHYINVQGDVESDKTIMITPKASATVEEILVRAGQQVNKGDVLAELDGEITRNQLNQAETQLELAKTLFKRQQNLREQNIGSEVEFLQAKTQFESAKSQFASLKEQYDFYTIRATISGTVDRVDLKVGETVGPTLPVFQISNSDALKVTTEVSEAYIMRVNETDSVEITFPSLNTSVQKRVDVVSRAINPSNRTFGVEIYLPGVVEGIRPNMMARVSINDTKLEDQIVVPVNSVQQANNIKFVFIAEETENGWIARNKEVTTGLNYGNDLVVTDGLNVGDLLITAGYANLSDGSPITIQEN